MQLLVFGVIVGIVLSMLFGAEHFMLFMSLGILTPIVVAIGWWVLSAKAEKRFERMQLKQWHDIAEPHKEALTLRFRQIVSSNPYGGLDMEPWKKELERFRLSVGIYGKNYLIADFDRELTEKVRRWVAEADSVQSHQDFTSVDPYDYERWCAQTLTRLGWHASATKASGDQGVDVIASKHGVKVAIQCKLQKAPVGNKAVQEVHAAAAFVDAQYATVVSPANYTPAARQLAGKLGVLLLHHSQLPDLDTLLEIESAG